MAKKAKKNNNEIFKNVALAGLAVGLTYGFASLAIDSGSLWHYSFTFIALYFAGHYIKLVVVGVLKKDEKSTKARRATK